VEILTAPSQRPSRDWLALAVTNKARAKIRQYLNTAEKQQALDIGRRHFERELRRFDLSLKKVLADPSRIETIAQEMGIGTKLDDVFAAVGYGKVSVRQVLAKLVPPDKLEEPPAEVARPLTDAVKRLFRPTGERITVGGADGLLIYRAKCCNPINGEPIVGYITRGKGVSVHARSCPNVVNLMYDPERRVSVEWEHATDHSYEVRVSVEVEDRPGLLAAITTVLAGMNTDIRNAEARTFDGRTAAVELTVRVQDLKHLERIVKAIRGLSGVMKVERQTVLR
jgi:guanosine-3',5'-bis(diphosphate) 3'-pyrophosphohydrolase